MTLEIGESFPAMSQCPRPVVAQTGGSSRSRSSAEAGQHRRASRELVRMLEAGRRPRGPFERDSRTAGHEVALHRLGGEGEPFECRRSSPDLQQVFIAHRSGLQPRLDADDHRPCGPACALLPAEVGYGLSSRLNRYGEITREQGDAGDPKLGLSLHERDFCTENSLKASSAARLASGMSRRSSIASAYSA